MSIDIINTSCQPLETDDWNFIKKKKFYLKILVVTNNTFFRCVCFISVFVLIPSETPIRLYIIYILSIWGFLWKFLIMIFKTDLICITIFSAFCKGKSSSESILVFICLWDKTSEILLFNITRYLILSKILSCFSSEWIDARYLGLSYFLLYPSTLSKIILKSLWIVCSFLCKMINQEDFVWFFLPINFFYRDADN